MELLVQIYRLVSISIIKRNACYINNNDTKFRIINIDWYLNVCCSLFRMNMVLYELE